MNSNEAFKILTVLKSAYPNSYRGLSEEETLATVTLWTKSMSDIPYKLISRAVEEHILQNTFPPTISEIRDRVKSYHWKAVKLLNQHYNATVGVHVKTAVFEEWVRSGEPLDEKTLRQAIDICKVTSKLTGECGALPLIQAIEQRNLLVGGER